jgi:hypothetical protein
VKLLSFRIAISLLSAAACWAQITATSQMSGSVQDSTGLAVPGATVTLTNTETGAARTVNTKEDGSYLFTQLPAGSYGLRVVKDGFNTYNQRGIELQVDSNPQINVTLAVGAVTQEVTVQASAAMVETHSNGLGQVIDQQRVVDLPLNGRNVTQLISLSGAAVPNTGGGLVNTLDYPTAASFSIAGSQGNATNYFLDGGTHLDLRTNVGLPLPFPDALEEFKVETSTLPANFGNHPGGAVNAITKSGTNTIHGDLFEFVRNYIFDGRPAFATVRDSLHRNQFGGTFGAPIIKNRLFIFGGYQGTIERTAPATNISYVPTAAVLQGNFQTILSPACQGGKQINLLASSGAVNNIVPQSLLNPVALNFAKLLPVSSDPCGKLQYGVPTIDNENQEVVRADFQRTASDSLFFRYFITNYTLQAYYDKSNLLTANTAGLNDGVQSAVMGDTRVINSTTVNSFRATFARTSVLRHDADGIPTLAQLGSNIYAPIANFDGQFSVSNYFSAGGALPGYVFTNSYIVSDEVALTKGAHQLAIGFSWIHPQMNGNGQYQINPGMTFNGTLTGNALADFMTGSLDTISQGGGQVSRDGQNIPSLYIQDSWKVSRRLQINTGLRWDPFIPQHTKYGYAAQFNPAAFYAGQGSKVYPQAPPGLTFPGDPGFPGKSDTSPRYADFAPRFGLVFDPRGKGVETIRVGYGIFYDSSYMWNTLHVPLNPPWGQTISLTAPAGGLSNPWQAYPGGDPFPFPPATSSTAKFPIAGVYVFEPANAHPTYLQQWNVAFQKQVKSWLFSATYLGNHTVHQWLGTQLNPAVYVPGGPCTLLGVTYNPCSSTASTNGRRQFALANAATGQYFGSVAEIDDGGTASYNALLLSAQHRFIQHFSWLGNYTLSHCLDQGEASQDIGSMYQDPRNRLANSGNCANDHRQIFNNSLVVESPNFASHWAERIAGHWQASAILTDISGAWLNVTDGVDNSLTANNNDRPSLVGTWQLSNPTLHQDFNTVAFAKSPAGTFGNAGRDIMPGRANWDLDVAVWRSFTFMERKSIDFRAEAFNAVNHVQYGNPNTSLNAATFGQITSSANPRIVQMALKFRF